MKKTSNAAQSDADRLFASSSKACRELHKAAKKQIRARKRKEWWNKNGSNGSNGGKKD